MEQQQPVNICANCGRTVEILYCSSCGEKRIQDRDRRISSLIAGELELWLNFDSKIFRTVALLSRHPGRLTMEFWNGRRNRYVRPFQLLIILNLFYFAAAYIAQHLGFSARVMFPTLEDILSDRYFSSWADSIVRQRIVELNMDLSTYTHAFNNHLENAARSTEVMIVPISGFFLSMFYFRPKREPLFHLIAATHLVCFYIFFWSMFLIVLGIMSKLSLLFGAGWLRYISVPVLLSHIFLALRTMYQRSVMRTVITSGLFVFVVITAITNVYNLILFCIVYLLI